jgi:filamentous hemagglutinin family protein
MKYSILLSMTTLCTAVHADITHDGTLGIPIALEGPDYSIGANLGQQRGTNLFHSFGEFNINIGESATFSGPENIHNVIGRVTGGNPSNIDGILRSTMPEADLYLINPAGMMFGPNAQLDVQGSFHASTADTLRFSDGSQFNARNPADSALTIAPVSAFGFLTNSPNSLSIEGKGQELSIPDGETLSFIGGGIKIDKALLKVVAGRINIASVASQGDVMPLAEGLTLSANSGDINLQNSLVTVSSRESYTGGSIYIRAGQFFLSNASLNTNTLIGEGGIIDVQADNLMATQGSLFSSNTLGSGQGGNITMKVNGLTEFSGWSSSATPQPSGIFSMTDNADGNAGTLALETGFLNLKEGALISATTNGQGSGGHININATDSISLSGIGSQGQGSAIAANTRGTMENAGNGGVINLTARDLSLTDGAQIGTSSFGTGQGGQINLKATDGVYLSSEDNRGITSSISTVGAYLGDGGNIALEAKRLNLLGGTSIKGDSGGAGQGGNIKIRVSDLVKLKGLDNLGYGSYITANASGEMINAGDGGTIELTTEHLQLSDGAQIGTSTFGPGQSGKVDIEVTKSATFSGQDQSEENYSSGLFTSSQGQTDNAGQGGTIVLKVGDLRLTDNAEINVGTYGPAKGGSVSIQANTVKLTDGGKITALSEALGNAGRIEVILTDKLIIRNGTIETKADSADGGDLSITTPSYLYLIDGQITTSVNEEFGQGGNITARSEFIVLDGGRIFAKAKKGKGGNIDVTTTGIYNFTGEPIEEIINASSEFGVDGVVVINSPDEEVAEKMLSLSSTFDTEYQMKNSCEAMNYKEYLNISHFEIHAIAGSSQSPYDLNPSRLSRHSATSVNRPATQTGNLKKRQEKQKLNSIALLIGCSRAHSEKIVPPTSRVVPDDLLF